MSALNKQVGGSHYKDGVQPVEYIAANNLNYFEGNAVKYITRHRKKGQGRQDIQKAIHYLEMLLEIEYPEPEDTKSVSLSEVDNDAFMEALQKEKDAALEAERRHDDSTELYIPCWNDCTFTYCPHGPIDADNFQCQHKCQYPYKR